METKQKGKPLYLLYLGEEEERSKVNFHPWQWKLETKQKGKPLCLLYLGEGEKRSKGTFHLW